MSLEIKASICIATFNKRDILVRVLESICDQHPPFNFEVIIVDDGSSDATPTVPDAFPSVTYVRNDNTNAYRNPAIPRNMAYKYARGDVLVPQSDDVVHCEEGTIEQLVTELAPQTFSIAHVRNTDANGVDNPLGGVVVLTGNDNRRPLFFLGAILRADMYLAGGNDERYTSLCCEDDALANSLIHGVGLQPRYVSARGNHIDHPRPPDYNQSVAPSYELHKELTDRKIRGEEPWVSPGAPWPYIRQTPMLRGS